MRHRKDRVYNDKEGFPTCLMRIGLWGRIGVLGWRKEQVWWCLGREKKSKSSRQQPPRAGETEEGGRQQRKERKCACSPPPSHFRPPGGSAPWPLGPQIKLIPPPAACMSSLPSGPNTIAWPLPTASFIPEAPTRDVTVAPFNDRQWSAAHPWLWNSPVWPFLHTSLSLV